METSFSVFFFFCFVFFIDCSVLKKTMQDVQVKLGDDVTLQCQITTDEIISVLKWSRADLNTDGYVYFYRNKRFYENYQHPSFHGRVKLRDPEMKDGDVSLMLNNVMFNDTGIYGCHVAVRKSVRSKRAHTEISHFINLTVTGEFVYMPWKLHYVPFLGEPLRMISCYISMYINYLHIHCISAVCASPEPL
uniref:Ig-like domain-containing protein n=1 Tax=Oreochromis niloticus TaxID=8128 RepID=A0A669BKL1_ORENI